jgi:hypothetical protein
MKSTTESTETEQEVQKLQCYISLSYPSKGVPIVDASFKAVSGTRDVTSVVLKYIVLFHLKWGRSRAMSRFDLMGRGGRDG